VSVIYSFIATLKTGMLGCHNNTAIYAVKNWKCCKHASVWQ